MKLLNHEKPKLKMPEFKVDEILSKHLNVDPLLKNMNKSFCCGLIGKAGSGKTSHEYDTLFINWNELIFDDSDDESDDD